MPTRDGLMKKATQQRSRAAQQIQTSRKQAMAMGQRHSGNSSSNKTPRNTDLEVSVSIRTVIVAAYVVVAKLVGSSNLYDK